MTATTWRTHTLAHPCAYKTSRAHCLRLANEDSRALARSARGRGRRIESLMDICSSSKGGLLVRSEQRALLLPFHWASSGCLNQVQQFSSREGWGREEGRELVRLFTPFESISMCHVSPKFVRIQHNVPTTNKPLEIAISILPLKSGISRFGRFACNRDC